MCCRRGRARRTITISSGRRDDVGQSHPCSQVAT
jgi:hypothetical protein